MRIFARPKKTHEPRTRCISIQSQFTLIFTFETKENITLGNEKTKSGLEELKNSDYLDEAGI